ncbi:MAG: DUF374 domain-containing protein [Acidobacteriota bacterium]|nr:MAG: DUF374 domain-containing protein [Acidobacteriota bacterium]
MRDALILAVVPRIASAYMRFLYRSMRLRSEGAERMDALLRERRSFILAFWHARLFIMRYAYRDRPEGITTLVSRHRDGELIGRTMECFGHRVLRGSSTRGGVTALREVVRALQGGTTVGFTPDGPRGPRHRAQPGVVQAARLSGAPILPASFSASKKKSSHRGTGFCCRIRSRGDSSFTESPSSCRGTRARRSWRKSAPHWSARSTSSRTMRTGACSEASWAMRGAA